MTVWLYILSGLVAICTVILYAGLLPFEGIAYHTLWCSRFCHNDHTSTAQPTKVPNSSWDQLYHLGGNSPWIPKTSGIISSNVSAPGNCRVDQVHMLSRHAERYPTVKAGLRMLNLYHRIAKHDHSMNGSLSFANEWDFLTQDPARHYENLVSTGPYAGTLEAFATGVKLRTRYIDLLEAALARGKVSFWASGSDRVEETARYFGAGFFGLDWERHARLQVIPETSDLGADTLTPGDTCLDYANDVNDFGHAYGARMLSEFRGTYIPAIASRLAEENASLKFSEDEVYAMQEICGFETLAKGSSPWCDVFTHDEWESFEYARDVLHYYRAGPGNPYGATMGWLYLNATANLLRSGPEAGELFLSFVHDGDITPFLTALSLLPQTPHLPTTQPLRNRTWRTSDVVPMGGRVLLERLACPAPVACWDNAPFYPNHVYCESPRDELSVRVNVNDGVVAIPGCDGGAGGSCPLEEFLERVERRGREVGDFGEQVGDFGAVCGLGEDAPDGITFLHQ